MLNKRSIICRTSFFNATKNYFFKINTLFNSLLILPKRNYMILMQDV
nr:MAG TPA: hypothetical protein [Caudoviricetes sp.]